MLTKVRPSDTPTDEKEESNSGLLAGAQDLVRAIQADDHKGVAEAFKALFQLCESEPHDEIEHDNDSEEQE